MNHKLTTIESQLTIAASPQATFTALTEENSLTSWFSEFAHVALSEGRFSFWGRFTPEAPAQEQAGLALRDFKPNQALTFAWTVRQAETVVEIRLNPHGQGTKLHLRHSGVPAAKPNDYSLADFWSLSLENLRSWLERQTVGTRCDFSAIQQGQLRLTVEIEANQASVFQALIRPEELQRYISAQASVEPEVGGRYSYGWEAGGPIKILELVPEQKLAFSWGYTNEPETVVSWSLAGSGGKTQLTLVQSGFAPTRRNGDYQVGWLNYLNRIKFLLEVGPTWQKPVMLSSD